MFTAYSIALSALSADSTAIDAVGNDLANLNTTGYKATEIEFQNLMSQTIGTAGSGAQVGMGVAPISTEALYTQGTLTSTNGPTDAAIQGNGFFVVQNSDAQTLYTRDGSFQVNSSGTLVTQNGDAVQGWSAVKGVINSSGPTGDLTLPLGTVIPATATTSMSITANLDSSSATGATFSAPIQVIDSLGQSHTLSVNFTETSANNWSYTVTIPSADLASGGNNQIASGTMTFDKNGNLTAPAQSSDPQVLKITGLADGAADLNINWSLYNSSGTSNITQYDTASGVGGTTQNGLAAGQISNVSLQNGGLLVATYSNGQQSTVGQLALANIPNPDTLISIGNNELEASPSTGGIALGAANTGGLGQVVAGSLENSTVDIATEFTSLLTYERSYQAASRVITASDQTVQDVMNLIQT